MQISIANSNSAGPKQSNAHAIAAMTGCVSKLSVIETHEHAYFAALKDYSDHYAEAQAYLSSVENDIEHDYDLIGSAQSEPDHGLLGDDGEAVIFAQVSDDDIDRCGYLGWLRH